MIFDRYVESYRSSMFLEGGTGSIVLRCCEVPTGTDSVTALSSAVHTGDLDIPGT